MNPRKQTHILRLPDRTCKTVITERKKIVVFEITMTRYGWSREAEFEACHQWLKPLFEHYENDPRPIVIPIPSTGQLLVLGAPAQEGRSAFLTCFTL